MHAYRTHSCDALRIDNRGETVRLSGRIQTKRSHGGLVFVDLKDQSGITQVVIEDESLVSLIDSVRVE